MITFLFVAWCGLALGWLAHTLRQEESASVRALMLCWQFTVLSLIPGPGGIGGRQTFTLGYLLAAAAMASFIAHLQLNERPTVAWHPWLVVYGAVFVSSSALSTAPLATMHKTGSALFLVFVGCQTGYGLRCSTLRTLLRQFVVWISGATAVGLAASPSKSLRSIKAPVIDVMLESPVLGLVSTKIALAGLCVVATHVSVRYTNRTPDGRLRPIYPALQLLMMGVGVALVFLSLRRAAWLALAVGAGTWTYYQRRRLFVPAACATAVLVAAFTLFGPLRELWDREQARPVDNIMSIRGGIFRASFQRFRDRPLLGNGAGLGDVNLLIDTGQSGFLWSSHSDIGTALAATGLAGLAVVVWGYGLGWVGATRAWRNESDPMPFAVMAAAMSVLPFWSLLSRPNILLLPVAVFVFPTFKWRTVRIQWLVGPRSRPTPSVRSEG